MEKEYHLLNTFDSMHNNMTEIGSEGGHKPHHSVHWVLGHSLALTGNKSQAEGADHKLLIIFPAVCSW